MAITWKDCGRNLHGPRTLFQVGDGLSGYTDYEYSVYDDIMDAAVAAAELSTRYMETHAVIRHDVGDYPDPLSAKDWRDRIAESHSVLMYFVPRDGAGLSYVEIVAYWPDDASYGLMADVFAEDQD